MSSIVIGLVVGYVVAYFMGMIDFSSVQSYSGVNIPVPLNTGWLLAGRHLLPSG